MKRTLTQEYTMARSLIIFMLLFLVSCVPAKTTNKKKVIEESSSAPSLLPSAIVGPTSIAPQFVNAQAAVNSDSKTADCTLDVMIGWK